MAIRLPEEHSAAYLSLLLRLMRTRLFVQKNSSAEYV